MQTIKDEWAASPLNPVAATKAPDAIAVFKQAVLLSARGLAAFGVFLLGWSVLDPRFPSLSLLDPRAIAFAMILLAAGIIDLGKGVVPTVITYPLMLAGIVRAFVLGDPSFLLYWFALALIYLLNVVGGGDVKLLMGLFGLFPNFEFFLVLELVVIATHLPIVLYRRLRRCEERAGLLDTWMWVRWRVIQLVTGETTPRDLVTEVAARRPTDEQLSQHGDRLAIAFALAGILYLWLMTPVGLNWNFRI